MANYHIGERASSGDVNFGAIFIEAACGGQMLERQLRSLCFQQFQSLEEVLVCPLFLLELPNSASYQKLASSSQGTMPLTRSSNFASPTIRFNANDRLGTDAPVARGLKNLPHIEPGNLLRNGQISRIDATTLELAQFDLWRLLV